MSFGQTTGGIDGTVTHTAGSPLPGATVVVSSPSLQGTRTAASGREGVYRIPATPPGEYRVTASLAGFRTIQKTATVRLGATATADFILEPAASEQVLVSGQAPLIDKTSTTAGTNYTSETIRQLPVDRNYAAVALATPGAGTDSGYTDGRFLRLTIYGATSAENQWMIDGVNTTDVRWGTQGKAMSNEFVQELEVKTGGYGAESGRATGGIINVVTKSGGNQFHGDVFAYYDSTDTMAEERFESMDHLFFQTELDDGTRLDYGADLGGFLLKDRLWFFGSYDRVELDAHVSSLRPHPDVPEDHLFPLNAVADLYSGKLTWNIATSTTLVGGVFADPTSNSGLAGADPRRGLVDLQPRAPVSTNPSTWYTTRLQGGVDYSLRATQLFGPDVVASLQGSYHQGSSRITAADEIRREDRTCVGGTPDKRCIPAPQLRPNSVTGGYGYNLGGNNSMTSREQFSAAATFYRGAHEISVGGDYLDGRDELTSSYTGGQQVTTFNDYGELYYRHRFFARSLEDPTPVPSVHATTQVLDYGAYVQDSWRASSALTINLGLRWDGEQPRDAAGQTALGISNQWQPRIGLVWDPWRDGTTKVYAFAGRFSYAMGTYALTLLFPGDIPGWTTYNFDPVSTVHNPNVFRHEEAEQDSPSVGIPVDGGLKFPSQDELLLGVERLIAPGLMVGLKGTYRELNNVIAFRADLNYHDPLTGYSQYAVINPGSGRRYARGDVPTCNGLNSPFDECSPTGPATPEASRIYRGVELLARQTIGSDLWLQASYVHSSLRGNIDGIGGEISSAFGNPTTWYNGYGPLALDRPNRLRLDGYWATPWRLSIGIQAFVESGAPLDKVVYVGDYAGMGYLVPRGTAGRLPTLWEGNLQLSYPISFGPVTATLQAYLFNLFNNQIPIATSPYWAWEDLGDPDAIFDPNREQDDPDYGLVLARSAPRLFRAAVRLSF